MNTTDIKDAESYVRYQMRAFFAENKDYFPTNMEKETYLKNNFYKMVEDKLEHLFLLGLTAITDDNKLFWNTVLSSVLVGKSYKESHRYESVILSANMEKTKEDIGIIKLCCVNSKLIVYTPYVFNISYLDTVPVSDPLKEIYFQITGNRI